MHSVSVQVLSRFTVQNTCGASMSLELFTIVLTELVLTL